MAQTPLPYGKCGHNVNVCTCKIFVYDADLTYKKNRQAHEAAAKLREIIRKHQNEKKQ